MSAWTGADLYLARPKPVLQLYSDLYSASGATSCTLLYREETWVTVPLQVAKPPFSTVTRGAVLK